VDKGMKVACVLTLLLIIPSVFVNNSNLSVDYYSNELLVIKYKKQSEFIVKIGVLLTDDYDNLIFIESNGVLDGILSAAYAINASSLFDFKIEIYISEFDIGSNELINSYNEMKNLGIKLIIGSFSSEESETIVKLAEEDEIVILSLSASSPKLDKYSYFFSTFPSENNKLETLADLIINLKYKNTAILYESGGPLSSPIILDNFNKFDAMFVQNGGKILFTSGYEIGRNNYSVITSKIDQFPNLESLVIIGSNSIGSIISMIQGFERKLPMFSPSFLPIRYLDEESILTEINEFNNLIAITAFRQFNDNQAYNDLRSSLGNCASNGICNSNFITSIIEEYAYDALNIGALAINLSESYTGSSIKNNMFKASKSYFGVTGNKTFDSFGSPIHGIYDILQIQNTKVHIVGQWSLTGNKEIYDNFDIVHGDTVIVQLVLSIFFASLVTIIIAFIYIKRKKSQILFIEFIESGTVQQLRKMYHKILIGLGNSNLQLTSEREYPQLSLTDQIDPNESRDVLNIFPPDYRSEIKSNIRGRTVLVIIEIAYLPFKNRNTSFIASKLELPRTTVYGEIKLLLKLEYIKHQVSLESLDDTRFKFYTLTEKGTIFLYLLKESINIALMKVNTNKDINFSIKT
jgi:hypothetical protein